LIGGKYGEDIQRGTEKKVVERKEERQRGLEELHEEFQLKLKSLQKSFSSRKKRKQKKRPGITETKKRGN